MLINIKYRIAGKFGGGKVWQIWQIVCDSPNYSTAQLQGKTRVVRSRVLLASDLASSLLTRRQLLSVLYYIIAITYYM